MQPNGGMQPLYTPFTHQIQPNAYTGHQLPQQPNMLPPPQFPYHHQLGNMGGPPLIPQSNPLVFPQNNGMGVGNMLPPPNGQFFNQPPNIFPPHPQTLMNQNPQLGLPFFGNPYFGAFGQVNPSMPPINSGPTQHQHQHQQLQSWPQPQAQANSHPQQGNSVEFNQGNVSNTNWKSGPGQNFSKNQNRGFQKKNQFHHGNSGQRNSGFQHQKHKKGNGNERAAKVGRSNQTNPPKEKKRSFALIYTAEEVRKWREERKRNYPTKAVREKKLSKTQASSQVVDTEAKIRREQLKEILAKQAELGVEVAEIPSHYLNDAEMPSNGNEKEENTRLKKRGRFQNRNDKRGRRNREDPANKKQKSKEADSSNNNHALENKKPTLLQKLLSKDIKKDQSSLVQVLRFITMNSFFKDFPEKPLKFPSVTVKESGFTEELPEEDKAVIGGEDASQESSKLVIEIGEDVKKDYENEELMKENGHGEVGGGSGGGDDVDDMNCSSHEEEEEGEIID